ncbi:MAG: SMP-30/gluconolactonase/LRE family protein, partial [Bacteroidales bacterium]|nr:SMP-30/gluconolactonase/LRE family protein [Bacteroidales bacterium]
MEDHARLTLNLISLPMKQLLLIAITAILGLTLQAQDHGIIYRFSEEAEMIFASGTTIELVADSFRFTEGPVWSPEGYLLFSDVPESKIYKVTEEDVISLFIHPSGNTNGLAFLPDGRLIGCQREPRRLAVIKGNGDFDSYVDRYHGKRFSSPNDLTVHSQGHVFFTDPPWGLDKKFQDPEKEISFSGVFMLNYHTGKISVIDSLLELPNGIALSPDEKQLYVAENRCNGDVSKRFDMPQLWMRYELDEKLRVVNREEFIFASDSIPPRSPDGMKVDHRGNLFCTGPGGLFVYNPEGEPIAFLKLRIPPSNCTFGGANQNILYITAKNA